MSKIDYSAKGFDSTWPSHFHGKHDISVNMIDLIWAAITVGKADIADLFTFKWHSYSDIIIRFFSVYANLKLTPKGFEKSDLYQAQDPTEKGATSYFLGMLSAKLFAEKRLDTPWLMHVSTFKAGGTTVALTGKSEPDLIGRSNQGNWIVVEAKGRSGTYDDKALDKAKQQTRQVSTVLGTIPALRVAIQSYFSPALSLRIHDPDEYYENAAAFEGNIQLAIRRYYASIRMALESSDRVEQLWGRSFIIREFDAAGVTVGLDQDTYRYLASEIDIQSVGVENQWPLPSLERRISDNNVAVYGDGLYVRLDDRWSDENMSREPYIRTVS